MLRSPTSRCTRALKGEAGSGQVQINGAAARLVSPGDKVIIVSYGVYDESELATCSPLVVHVDDRNRIVAVDGDPKVLLDEVS